MITWLNLYSYGFLVFKNMMAYSHWQHLKKLNKQVYVPKTII